MVRGDGYAGLLGFILHIQLVCFVDLAPVGHFNSFQLDLTQCCVADGAVCLRLAARFGLDMRLGSSAGIVEYCGICHWITFRAATMVLTHGY